MVKMPVQSGKPYAIERNGKKYKQQNIRLIINSKDPEELFAETDRP